MSTNTVEAKATKQSHRSRRIGVVVSDKRDKTRTVTVAYGKRHSKYGKILRQTAKYHVHDPENLAQSGDRVEIESCRPISKTKSWRLVRVLHKAQGVAATDLLPPDQEPQADQQSV